MRLLVCLSLYFFISATAAQTRISKPSARIDFSNPSRIKEDVDAFTKKTKEEEKRKREELKKVKKKLKKYSNISGDSLARYKEELHAFDSDELHQMGLELDQLNEAKTYKAQFDTFKEQEEQVRDTLQTKRTKKNGDVKHKKRKKRKEREKKKRTRKAKKSSSDQSQHKENVKEALEESEEYKQAAQLKEQYKATMDSATVDSLKSSATSRVNDKIQEVTGKDIKIDSLESSVVEDEIAGYLNDKIKLKKQERLDVAQYNPENHMPKSARQYIPSIEKFTYKAPVIPKEELDEAFIQKQVEERKNKLKNLLPGDTTGTARQKPSKRWQIGGYVQYIPQPQRVEITPTLGYFMREKWLLGAGYVYNITWGETKTRIEGYRFYVEPYFGRGYFLHLESLWSAIALPESPKAKEYSTLLGIGKSFRTKAIKSDIMLLYNFNAPNQTQGRQLSIRYGINILK